MHRPELKTYYNQPCRFKLRSGKEVFGVIWTENEELLFASIETYKAFAKDKQDKFIQSRLNFISEEEIIGVEVIPAMAS